MKFRKDLPTGDGKNYLKLKSGESVTGIFRGETYEFTQLWGGPKPIEVEDGTPGGKFRFRINFVVKEGAAYVVKVFEQGSKVYSAMAELNDIYPLDKTLMRITRQGSTMNDTTYSILPMPQPVTMETLKVLDTLQLNDLGGKKVKPEDQPPWDDAPPPAGVDERDELPF